MSLGRLALVAVLAVLAAGVGAAFATGMGPAPGSPGPAGAETTVERFPTESTANDTADGDAPRPAFDSRIQRVESCGTTCRDVTASVTNEGNATAEDVVVYTRIYVGDGTDGEVVWEGKRTVGTLAPGETYTDTERVTLTYEEALAIQRADGRVTVLITVQSADVTVTSTERMDLS